MDEDRRELSDGWIDVRGARIAAVGRGAPPESPMDEVWT